MPQSYVNWVLTIEVCILVLLAVIGILRSYRQPYQSPQMVMPYDPHRALHFGETVIRPVWKDDDALKLVRWTVHKAPKMEEPKHGNVFFEISRAFIVALLIIGAFVAAYYLLGYIGLGSLVGYPTAGH